MALSLEVDASPLLVVGELSSEATAAPLAVAVSLLEEPHAAALVAINTLAAPMISHRGCQGEGDRFMEEL